MQNSYRKLYRRGKSYTKNKDQRAEIFVSTTNNFREGRKDEYKKIGEVPVADQQYNFPAGDSKFYKIVLSTSDQKLNAWIVERDKR